MRIENYEWTFLAEVIEVGDGDTITVNRDCGNGIIQHDLDLRLKDVWAPETEGWEQIAGEYVQRRLEEKLLGHKIVYQSFKLKKSTGEKVKHKSFDRYVATVWLHGENINEWLIEEGLAARTKEEQSTISIDIIEILKGDIISP